VTLQLLWEEYARSNVLAYKYTSFCIKYRAWVAALARSMRQVHVAGERLFVDYAGQTVPIVDPATGEITPAQIFVATLGASNYTLACVTARQTLEVFASRVLGRLSDARAIETERTSLTTAAGYPAVGSAAPRLRAAAASHGPLRQARPSADAGARPELLRDDDRRSIPETRHRRGG
jgi:hypothetical protein